MGSSSKVGSFGWKDQRRRKAGHKGTKGGLAVCISACDDNENAQDKSVSNSNNVFYVNQLDLVRMELFLKTKNFDG